jgi:hypothetical protein
LSLYGRSLSCCRFLFLYSFIPVILEEKEERGEKNREKEKKIKKKKEREILLK